MSEALAGAQVLVNLSASPYRRGYGITARADARAARRGLPGGGRVREHRRRPGRARLRRPQRGREPRRRGAGALRRSSRSRSRSARIDPREVVAARLRDTRHRANVRRQRARGRRLGDSGQRTARASGRTRRSGRSQRGRRAWPRCSAPRRKRSTRRFAPGCATTSRRTASSTWCSALSGGIDSALVALIAVDALGPEPRDLRVHALPLLERGHPRRCARDRREPRHGVPRAVDRGRDGELLGPARRRLRGHRPGHRRGEPPGAHPRQRGDGALEQVRLARAHHRQQVRALGGLRHALRRHGRRLRRAQGRLQGAGLPARALAQRGGRTASWCPPRCSSARPRPSYATSSSTRTRFPPTTCSTRSSRATSRRTSTRPSWWPAGCPPTSVERVIAMVDRAEYKRRQAPPGIKISTRAFGRDRRLPITNGYRAASRRPCPSGTCAR